MQLFVNNLTNVDFSYFHPTRGLIGETWLASIVLDGELDSNGMVCDFGIVKKTLRTWLDTYIDHCLLVPKTSNCTQNLSQNTLNTSLEWRYDNKHIAISSPHQAITLVDATDITPHSIAEHCKRALRDHFGEGVANITLSFEPEAIATPFYHYSHGLKKHKGNCQRIAHGHRSKIEIWRNGELSVTDMQKQASNWADIYIATRSDILQQSSSQIDFAYRADQGEFTLSLPASCVDIIDTDTTVEFIASHIASTLKHQHPQDNFTVKAYEGIAKGAIVTI